MTRDPAHPLALAIEREDVAADRLAAAEHTLAEAEEERDEDRQDPGLAARLAEAHAAVDKATAIRDAAVHERQRLERALTGADPDAVRRVHARLLPPRPQRDREPTGRPAAAPRGRERAGVALRYGDDDDREAA